MSVFTNLANHIKIRDLMGFAATLRLPMTVAEALKVLEAQGGEAFWRPALVIEEDVTVGSVDYWSLREAESDKLPLRDVARVISADAIVSAESSAISAVGRFAEMGERSLFVVDERIVGTLDFMDLFKPAMRTSC